MLFSSNETATMLLVTLDELRLRLAKADALSHAAETLFDGTLWQDGAIDRRHVERLAHLISGTACAVALALEAVDELLPRGSYGAGDRGPPPS